jgi:hypothetical protein
VICPHRRRKLGLTERREMATEKHSILVGSHQSKKDLSCSTSKTALAPLTPPVPPPPHLRSDVCALPKYACCQEIRKTPVANAQRQNKTQSSLSYIVHDEGVPPPDSDRKPNGKESTTYIAPKPDPFSSSAPPSSAKEKLFTNNTMTTLAQSDGDNTVVPVPS